MGRKKSLSISSLSKRGNLPHITRMRTFCQDDGHYVMGRLQPGQELNPEKQTSSSFLTPLIQARETPLLEVPIGKTSPLDALARAHVTLTRGPRYYAAPTPPTLSLRGVHCPLTFPTAAQTLWCQFLSISCCAATNY